MKYFYFVLSLTLLTSVAVTGCGSKNDQASPATPAVVGAAAMPAGAYPAPANGYCGAGYSYSNTGSGAYCVPVGNPQQACANQPGTVWTAGACLPNGYNGLPGMNWNQANAGLYGGWTYYTNYPALAFYLGNYYCQKPSFNSLFAICYPYYNGMYYIPYSTSRNIYVGAWFKVGF